MTHIHAYSKSACVKCDASMRTINKAIENGTLAPSSVTVHMLDGTEPKAGKIHPDIKVIRIEDTEEQERLKESFRNRLGTQAPVFIVKHDSGAEVMAWNDFRPDELEKAIALVSSPSAVVTASA